MKKSPLLLLSFFALSGLASCGSDTGSVVIYTPLEDYRIAYLETRLKEELPNRKVVIQYLDTGTTLSRLQSEGRATDCDIVIGIEAANTEMLLKADPDLFETLDGYDVSIFTDDVMQYPSAKSGHPKYHILDKEAGSIILNKKVLAEKGLPAPTSFDDLLDEKYKGLIMMPNPKTSGTGYYFYNGLVSEWGEVAALDYFSELSSNIREFSTSGSGPVKSLLRDEIGIGLGMTFQAAKLLGESGRASDFEITYFEEGSPFTIYTNEVIKGKMAKEGVKEVYDFIFNKFVPEDKAKFNPEVIYKDGHQPSCEIPNYPTNVKYMSMNGLFDPEYKNNLLDKWNF